MPYIRTKKGIEKLTDAEYAKRFPAPKLTYIDKRKKEYGSAEEQIEFITENGLTAWKAKVDKIKSKYPKK